MANIHLHGSLGRKFKKLYKLDVNSPIQAVRALCSLVPGFKDHFIKGEYSVFVGDAKEPVKFEDLKMSGASTIHFIPAPKGAKSQKQKGVQQYYAGKTMAAVGVATGQTWLVMAGVSMAAGGAITLLSPKIAKDKDNYLFNGTPESIEEGTPVPLVYGNYLANTLPVSFTIETV